MKETKRLTITATGEQAQHVDRFKEICEKKGISFREALMPFIEEYIKKHGGVA